MQEDEFEFSPEGLQEIENVMREGTRIVCSTRDFSAALARFTEVFPRLAPHMSTLIAVNDGKLLRARCSILLREIWQRVLRPDHNFRPLPLPKQERNEPCPCGSGRKYKQCCARLDGKLPFDPQEWSLLRYVLEDLPTSAYDTLPFPHLPPQELAFVAEQWIQEGHADTATFLLVPLLSEVKKLDARHEAAFDILSDAYVQLGMPEQRVELVERVMQASDLTLRSAAMHRRCTIYSTASDWPAAWKLFAQAERLQPNNPALSHLEVLMLASEGQTEHAKERARYWLARLARPAQKSGDDPLVDFLHMMSEDPDAVLAMIRGEGEADNDGFLNKEALEWLTALLDVIAALPAPKCLYRLHPEQGDAGALQASPELLALEQQWRTVFHRNVESEENSPWENTEWLDWLTAKPENLLAWQSFAILEDISALMDETPAAPALGDVFEEIAARLQAHATSLLEVVIADNKAQGCRLAWCYEENRPALRLVENCIAVLDDVGEELRLLEWLVGTLNPSDNRGLRESLARVLVENGRTAEALALCERYPDDGLAGMLYAKVLALHQLGRFDDASAALAVACEKRPEVLRTLIATDPSAPDLDFDHITVGGKDEAWYYRMDWLKVWARLGGLGWLQKAAP